MNIAPHSSITLEGEPRPSLVQLRVNSRQWRKVVHVHQMEIDPSFPSKVEHRELKHFKEWFPWLFPSLSLPVSLCSSSPCMSMIAPTFLPLALPLSSVVSPFSLSMRTLFWGLHYTRELLFQFQFCCWKLFSIWSCNW